MKKIVILFSGGLDSNVLLQQAKMLGYEPYCLFIDYDQLHIQEKSFARKMCKKENVPFQTVTLGNLKIDSKLTNPNHVENEDLTISKWYVPSRNLMFVSIAASIAESIKAVEIWYGASYEDTINLFPDCTQEWVGKVNEVLQMNSNYKVKLRAPLLGYDQQQVETIARNFKINKSEIFSGYGNIK